MTAVKATGNKIVFEGFQFRKRGGGTPKPALALQQRGYGGAMLSIGGGRYAWMSLEDVELREEERAAAVKLRKAPPTIGEIQLDVPPTNRVISPAAVVGSPALRAGLAALEWIDLPDGNRIMEECATIGLVKAVVQASKRIGVSVEKATIFLARGKGGKVLPDHIPATYGSWEGARELVDLLNGLIPERRFALSTEAQFLSVKGQLRGSASCIYTETRVRRDTEGYDKYVVGSRFEERRFEATPVDVSDDIGIYLVERTKICWMR